LRRNTRRRTRVARWKAEGREVSVEKLEGNIDKLDQRIQTMLVQAEDKEGNK